MHEAKKEKKTWLIEMSRNKRHCAKLSSLHCLDLDPASGKLLMSARGKGET